MVRKKLWTGDAEFYNEPLTDDSHHERNIVERADFIDQTVRRAEKGEPFKAKEIPGFPKPVKPAKEGPTNIRQATYNPEKREHGIREMEQERHERLVYFHIISKINTGEEYTIKELINLIPNSIKIDIRLAVNILLTQAAAWKKMMVKDRDKSTVTKYKTKYKLVKKLFNPYQFESQKALELKRPLNLLFTKFSTNFFSLSAAQVILGLQELERTQSILEYFKTRGYLEEINGQYCLTKKGARKAKEYKPKPI